MTTELVQYLYQPIIIKKLNKIIEPLWLGTSEH